MNKTKIKKVIAESVSKSASQLNRVNQKPTGKISEITLDLLNSGLPVMQSNDFRLGTVKFDTPHLQKHSKTDTFMVAMLPQLIQQEFESFFLKKFPDIAQHGNGIIFHKGFIRQDNIFFSKIEKINSILQFPDLLITTDINSLYHNSKRLLSKQNFDTFQYRMNEAFTGIGLENTYTVFRFLAADGLVMVADKAKFDYSPMPEEWYELLHPAFANKLAFCGDIDFNCNTLHMHFVRDFGMGAIGQLLQNTLARLHPAHMLEAIQDGNRLGASVYIMPFSYARQIENNSDYQIIWPKDGAIMLPVQLLVKKGAYNRYKEIIRFLTGSEMGQLFASKGFVPVNVYTENIAYGKMNWIGWDFLEQENIVDVKHEISKLLK